METKKAILIDIDGTISDLSHRLHYVKPIDGGKKNWPLFYAEMGNDTVKRYCVELCNSMLQSGCACIFVTARPDSHRLVTDMWLRHVAGMVHFTLFMRGAEDYRPAPVIKKEIYEKHIAPLGYDVLFSIDDDPAVVDMWKSLGIASLEIRR